MFRKITKLVAMLMSIALAITVLPLNHMAFATTTPTAVKARILAPADTGDNVNWIEIAQYGNYSLIVRSNYLNWYTTKGYYGNASWQYVPYGATTAYSTSNVYSKINAWFNGSATGYADILPANAKLRNYTVENNALKALGTAGDENGKANGFSYPTDKKRGTGNDIAFALSYSEAVNFISNRYYTWQNSYVQSSAIAKENYKNISIPLAGAAGSTNSSGAWLRSPGYTSNGVVTAGSLSNGVKVDGCAFQFGLTNTSAERGFLYPALWVDSSIFGVKTFTVTYDANNETGLSANVTVNAGDNHKVLDQGYTNDGYTLAGYNTAADGSGTAYTVDQSFKVSANVTLYAQWARQQFTVTYKSNGGTGSDVIVLVDAGDIYTIKNQDFTNDGYIFAGFCIKADGKDVRYFDDNNIPINADLTLYAQWTVIDSVSYSVTYYPNGGDGSAVPYTVIAQDSHTVSNNGFSRTGYELKGFNTSEDGSGAFYALDTSITVSANLELYAVWESTTVQQYLVTYKVIDGTGVHTYTFGRLPAGTIHTVQSPDQLGINAEIAGRFLGWTTAQNSNGPTINVGDTLKITDHLTLFAKLIG